MKNLRCLHWRFFRLEVNVPGVVRLEIRDTTIGASAATSAIDGTIRMTSQVTINKASFSATRTGSKVKKPPVFAPEVYVIRFV
ncbi:MAG: hypothetical protein RLZZ78_802 [Armatimonadota bacterium]